MLLPRVKFCFSPTVRLATALAIFAHLTGCLAFVAPPCRLTLGVDRTHQRCSPVSLRGRHWEASPAGVTRRNRGVAAWGARLSDVGAAGTGRRCSRELRLAANELAESGEAAGNASGKREGSGLGSFGTYVFRRLKVGYRLPRSTTRIEVSISYSTSMYCTYSMIQKQ